VDTHSKNTLKILQLLLRCGMVCREELNVVLEMMPAVPAGRIDATEERAGAAAQQRKAERGRAAATPESLQKIPALEFDHRV
jgi:hypothetical protein